LPYSLWNNIALCHVHVPISRHCSMAVCFALPDVSL